MSVPDEYPNLWSLISTPDQTHIDKPTTPPFTGDSPRGFINANFDDIGAFLNNLFPPVPSHIPKSEIKEIGIAHDAFAVIDARTLHDETLVLVRWEVYDERIDPKSPDDSDEAFRRVEAWTDIRVPVVTATEMVGSLGLDLLIHDFKWHLREDDGVCLRDQVDERKKAMSLQ